MSDAPAHAMLGVVMVLIALNILLLLISRQPRIYSRTSSSERSASSEPLPVRPVGKRVLFWHVANTDKVVLRALEELKESAAMYVDEVQYSAHPPTSPGMLEVLRKEDWLAEVPQDRQRFPDETKRSYYEFPTLSALHEHCTDFPTDFVAYAHTKSKDTQRRESTLKLFPDFSVFPHGIDDTCVGELKKGRAACGINPKREQANGDSLRKRDKYLSKASWCHFSGNFWWARCDYVQKLNHPWHAAASDELAWEHPSGFGAQYSGNGNHDHRDSRALGRYFAEWWLLNDVKLDVLKKEVLPSFQGSPDVLKQWIAGYVPDANGVWRRAHLVNETASHPLHKDKWRCAGEAKEAFRTTGNWCVTDAARTLAVKWGEAYIWEWPATCPGAALLKTREFWDSFAAAETNGVTCKGRTCGAVGPPAGAVQMLVQQALVDEAT